MSVKKGNAFNLISIRSDIFKEDFKFAISHKSKIKALFVKTDMFCCSASDWQFCNVLKKMHMFKAVQILQKTGSQFSLDP